MQMTQAGAELCFKQHQQMSRVSHNNPERWKLDLKYDPTKEPH